MILDIIKSKSHRSRLVINNIIGSILIKGASIIVSLMLVPLTLGYVSSELYGIWLTLSSIMMWLNFFDIGFTLGLKNKLSESIALGDYNSGKSLVSTTYFMMIIIFIPLCILLSLIIPHINWSSFLNVDNVYNEEITKTLYILVACFCLQMIANVLTAVISAYQKVALSSIFPVIGNILSLALIFLLTKLCSPSLTYLALSISLMPILVLIVASILLYSKTFYKVSPSINCIKKKYIKTLFGLGSKFFIIQIQVVILYQCTNILISNVSGPNEVTEYNIAYKYLGIAMMLYTIILTPLWPAFTDAYTKKDFEWMKSIYKKMIYVFSLSVIILVCMVIISPIMYKLWIGNDTKISFYMTITVALYMMIHSWDTLQVQLINGIGTIKLQTYVTLIGLVIHVPLSLYLGKQIGAIGVICSMIIINILYSCLFTIQIRKLLNKTAYGIWCK